jgi:hypothetical protein
VKQKLSRYAVHRLLSDVMLFATIVNGKPVMQSLRRMYRDVARATLAILPYPRLAALVLVVIIPGALVVPICYGIYGAIRHSLAGKAGEHSAPMDSVNRPVDDGTKK